MPQPRPSFVLKANGHGQRLDNCSVVSRFVCGGSVTISHDREEPALHNGFVGEIEASLRTEPLDARLREISTRSRKEFRRVLPRGAMLF
jgi:hypothetical protein